LRQSHFVHTSYRTFVLKKRLRQVTTDPEKSFLIFFDFLVKSIVPHFVFVRTLIVYKNTAILSSQFEDIVLPVMGR